MGKRASNGKQVSLSPLTLTILSFLKALLSSLLVFFSHPDCSPWAPILAAQPVCVHSPVKISILLLPQEEKWGLSLSGTPVCQHCATQKESRG